MRLRVWRRRRWTVVASFVGATNLDGLRKSARPASAAAAARAGSPGRTSADRELGPDAPGAASTWRLELRVSPRDWRLVCRDVRESRVDAREMPGSGAATARGDAPGSRFAKALLGPLADARASFLAL